MTWYSLPVHLHAEIFSQQTVPNSKAVSIGSVLKLYKHLERTRAQVKTRVKIFEEGIHPVIGTHFIF